jgi:hypothetical protein
MRGSVRFKNRQLSMIYASDIARGAWQDCAA